MKIKRTLSFLPVDCWVQPFGYSVYAVPVKYYSKARKLRLGWGLGYFYFSCLWRKNGSLGRFRWFQHLWLNFVTFVFGPYILFSNWLNSGRFNIVYRDI